MPPRTPNTSLGSVPQFPAERRHENPTARRISVTAWAALAVVYLVWSSAQLGIRVVTAAVPLMFSAGTRFIAAGLVLAGLLAWREGAAELRVTLRQLLAAAAVGLLLLVGGIGMVVLAEESVPSGLAALLIIVTLLWVVVLHAVTGERVPAITFLGVLVGLAGSAVLIVPGLSGQVKLGGVLTAIAAALLWSIGSFFSPRLPFPRSPLAAGAYEMLAGGAGCLLVGLVRWEKHDLNLDAISTVSWPGLAHLVLFGGLVAFTAYAWLLGTAPHSGVATCAYVNPVVAVFLGWLILGEPLSWPVLLGAAIVVAGVFLVVSTERRR
ncbi:drug/metabolite transporter (DMT)-like permease [Streptomyces sp. BK340]|nr:drug/metabolite transporter (DMT)-like permease [Streptomyces sp. BK340]